MAPSSSATSTAVQVGENCDGTLLLAFLNVLLYSQLCGYGQQRPRMLLPSPLGSNARLYMLRAQPTSAWIPSHPPFPSQASSCQPRPRPCRLPRNSPSILIKCTVLPPHSTLSSRRQQNPSSIVSWKGSTVRSSPMDRRAAERPLP